jgi:hypothetical protein
VAHPPWKGYHPLAPAGTSGYLRRLVQLGLTSIYDLARQCFGGTIALREHFRCVPDIIDFSNRLSYDGEIRPLRDPASAPRPHVVEYAVDGAAAEGRTPGLLVEPVVARRQLDAEQAAAKPTAAAGRAPAPPKPLTRFHGTVVLDATRVGRNASRIADEVIAHLKGLVGARVTVTLEIEAEIPSGAPDTVVRTVTENARTLGFASQGFEVE